MLITVFAAQALNGRAPACSFVVGRKKKTIGFVVFIILNDKLKVGRLQDQSCFLKQVKQSNAID